MVGWKNESSNLLFKTKQFILKYKKYKQIFIYFTILLSYKMITALNKDFKFRKVEKSFLNIILK